MRNSMRTRTLITYLLTFCLLLLPITALAKKGDKNFKRGMDYEAAQQWDKAAQEYTLAVAADPSNMEYQLHFRRASFNASQTFMQQGRALAEQRDFVGAYNAFRQAYGYDPVNELAVSEMQRMLYLQNVKEGKPTNTNGARGGEQQETSLTPVSAQQQELTAVHTENIIQPLNPYIYGFGSPGNRAGLGGGSRSSPFERVHDVGRPYSQKRL